MVKARKAVLTGAVALLAIAGGHHLLASPAGMEKGPPAKREGTPVKVTEEMRGAGMVSSGISLPPIPPVTGNRKQPVPSWGKPLPFPIVIADRRNNRLMREDKAAMRAAE